MKRPTLNSIEVPPVAGRVESVCQAHGETWLDYYSWLKADNWKEVLDDPSKLPQPIADYIKEENDYYDKSTAHLATLRKEIAAEIRGRMPDQIESIPEPDGPYLYQFCTNENADYPVFIRTDLQGNFEELLFDVGEAATGFDYFDYAELDYSPDHSMLFWSCDTVGSEFYTLYFRDITTGVDREYCIDNVDTAVWADNQTIFYTRQNEDRKVLQVFKHVLDSNPEDDVLVFTEQDKRFSCCVEKSYSREYIFIQTATFDEDEWWYIPLNNIDAVPTLIQARQESIEYVVYHQADRFVIRTNAQGAEDWKIVEAPVISPSIENWLDVVPHNSGCMVVDVIVYENWIVWLELVNALGQIAYMDNKGVVERIQFDEEAYSLGIEEHYGYRANVLMFHYSSPTTPWETYQYELQSKSRSKLKTQIIPSGHNQNEYVVRRFSVGSHDGVHVPVTLLYHRDTAIDGTAPALLYGYGCYGASSTADFEYSRLSLVDRGFVYAIAHVRGGSEKGQKWSDDAKLEKKSNSFHDFIAVGDALVEQEYCAPGNIVSLGGSAGGLLVGASMHMKPTMFAGVIAEVPDVDVLNVMLDPELYGVIEHWTEWGNPVERKAIFDAMRAYSPYDNTIETDYPAIFATAGVSDPRVFHWQPAKWVANLRWHKTDNNVILLKTQMQSGHFGKTGRFAHIEDNAHMYAFAVAVTKG